METEKKISPYDQAYQNQMAKADAERPKTPIEKKVTPYDQAYQQKMAQKGAEENAAKLKETKPTLTEKVKNYVDDKQQKYAQKFIKDDVEYPENKVVSQKDEQLLNQTGGIDMTGEAAKTGATTNKLLQNVETPRWKRKSLKDIWNDPEMKDVRGGILANAVGTALANFSGGLSGTNPNYQSDLAKFNEEQAANYSRMQAEKDAQAQQANIDAIKAANAQKVALETKLADTIADRYIKQFNAASDVEIKNKVLNQMLNDSDELFSNIKDEQQLFDLATYMGLLSGDFSLTARLVQKYVPQLLDKLDGVKSAFGKWGLNTDTPTPVSDEVKKKYENLKPDENGMVGTVGGNTVSVQDIEDNPNKYQQVYLGNGEYITLEKNSIADDKDEDYAKWLVENPNIANDEERRQLYNFGRYGVWDKPVVKIGKDGLDKAIAERDLTQQQLDEQNAAIKDYNEKTVKAINDQKNLLAKGTDPQKIIDWADRNKLNEFADTTTLTQYNGLISSAYDKKVNAELSAIENAGWDSSTQLDEYDRILKDYSNYLSDSQKKSIKDKREVAYRDAKIMAPYLNSVNKSINSNFTYNGGLDKFGITKDGNISYTHNGSGTGTFPSENDPGTFNFSYGTLPNLFNELVYETTPDSIRAKMNGDTDKERLTYFYNSPTYKMMKKLVKNPTVEKYANSKENETFTANYNTLKNNWNKLAEGTFFK